MPNPLKKAHSDTDKRLARIEAHIRAIYRRAGKNLSDMAEHAMDRFKVADERLKAQYEAGKITLAEYRERRQIALIQAEHYKRLEKQLADAAVNADKIAVAYVNGEMPTIYALNINAANTVIKNAVAGYSFELLDAHTVRNLAIKNPRLLPYKIVNGKKVERWARTKIKAELTQGILRGESIPKIAKRMQNVTGMQSRYAVTNARTMVTSAENKGRLDGMEEAQEKGVVLEKEWLATNDNRTRDWHADLDGQRKDLNEPFFNDYGRIMFPGDPEASAGNVYNCRCTLVTHIKGFMGKNGYARANNGYDNLRYDHG